MPLIPHNFSVFYVFNIFLKQIRPKNIFLVYQEIKKRYYFYRHDTVRLD